MSGQPSVREALAADAVLGESPVWSPTRQRLLWVDTEGRWLHALTRRADTARARPCRTSSGWSPKTRTAG